MIIPVFRNGGKFTYDLELRFHFETLTDKFIMAVL